MCDKHEDIMKRLRKSNLASIEDAALRGEAL